MTLETDKKRYYESTRQRAIRADLEFSIDLVESTHSHKPVAIDCGCGAGADVEYLAAHGFTVHAFDVDPLAVASCTARFTGHPHVSITQATFVDFDYPDADLVCADASLFFCPPRNFDNVWRKITQSLVGGGVFCGSFLGPRDTMAAGFGNHDSVLWPDVLVLDEAQVRDCLDDYDVIRFTEHNTVGRNHDDAGHRWHIFAVVAVKRRSFNESL